MILSIEHYFLLLVLLLLAMLIIRERRLTRRFEMRERIINDCMRILIRQQELAVQTLTLLTRAKIGFHTARDGNEMFQLILESIRTVEQANSTIDRAARSIGQNYSEPEISHIKKVFNVEDI